MTRSKFFASLVAGIVGLIALPRKAESYVIGSRLEGELLSPQGEFTESERCRKEWERMRKRCVGVSGEDENGILNEGQNPSESMLNGGVYYYAIVFTNGKWDTEVVYLAPISWGSLGKRGIKGACEKPEG